VKNQFLYLDLKEYFDAFLAIRIILKHIPPNCELPTQFCVFSVEVGGWYILGAQ
jgi:hypothetical protein